MMRAPMITFTGALGLDALSHIGQQSAPHLLQGRFHQQKPLPRIFLMLFFRAQ